MEVWTIISPETFPMMGRKKKTKKLQEKENGRGNLFLLSAPDEKLTAMEKKKKSRFPSFHSIELRNDTVSDDIQQ